jgi:hypothetical protein
VINSLFGRALFEIYAFPLFTLLAAAGLTIEFAPLNPLENRIRNGNALQGCESYKEKYYINWQVSQ